MTYRMLQAAVGTDGRWEDWSRLNTPHEMDHAAKLAAKKPRMWRIVKRAADGPDFVAQPLDPASVGPTC